jgi:hypothetical protein
MPEPVLTTDALLYCAHSPASPAGPPPDPGRFTVASPAQTVLTVDGMPVLLIDDIIAAKPMADCANVANNLPCKSILPEPKPTGSTVLTVNGIPVATKATKATTAPAPPSDLKVVAPGQTTLTAG